MESGSQIISANDSTKPSCEFAASSSPNSLSGGSPIAASSKQRKLPKICLFEPPAKRKKIETEKSKALADALVEEVDFLGGLVSSNEKERTDMKLEIVDMKQEITDMKQEIADMKQEIADMKLEIADMKLEKADMKLKINTLTFGLQRFVGNDDDIQFYTGFPSSLL